VVAAGRTAVVALAATAALLVAPALGAGSARPVRATVRIFDNYYAPARLTVPAGSTIVWKWPTDVGDTHDVKLLKGPRGVRAFLSDPAAVGYVYRRKLTVAGRYAFICTFHEAEMTMTVTVRRAPRR